MRAANQLDAPDCIALPDPYIPYDPKLLAISEMELKYFYLLLFS